MLSLNFKVRKERQSAVANNAAFFRDGRVPAVKHR